MCVQLVGMITIEEYLKRTNKNDLEKVKNNEAFVFIGNIYVKLNDNVFYFNKKITNSDGEPLIVRILIKDEEERTKAIYIPDRRLRRNTTISGLHIVTIKLVDKWKGKTTILIEDEEKNPNIKMCNKEDLYTKEQMLDLINKHL